MKHETNINSHIRNMSHPIKIVPFTDVQNEDVTMNAIYSTRKFVFLFNHVVSFSVLLVFMFSALLMNLDSSPPNLNAYSIKVYLLIFDKRKMILNYM